MTKARAKLGSNATGVFAAEPEPAPIVSDARPDREGRKPMPFWTTEAAKKQLRMMAAEMDTSQQELMTEALNMLFQKHGKPPIA
jgi:hypothetical protein